MMSENVGVIEQLARELLGRMGIAVDTLGVEEEGESFKVEISSKEDSGILIGYLGENLDSFQRILSFLCYKTMGEWRKILVDVEGYREVRRERLESLAVSAARRAKFFQDPVTLPPMSSFERRIVHLKVAEIPGVWTESVGEGRERRVVIYPGDSKGVAVEESSET